LSVMLLMEPFNPLITSFPSVPSRTLEKYPGHNLLRIRPFGVDQKDLEINFDQDLRPYITTKVLHSCTLVGLENDSVIKNTDTDVDESFFWDLSLGKRIECLLALVKISAPQDSSSIDIHCLNQACRKQIGVDLSMEELAIRQHMADSVDHVIITLADRNIQLRKPIGRDQIESSKTCDVDENETIRHIIQRLIIRDDQDQGINNQEWKIPGDDWIGDIDNAMSEFDPLVNFSISITCPYCENEGKHDVDLEELALKKLHMIQRRLVHMIHRIAKNYHWSEQQILAIPSWRRSQYISLIEKGENGNDWLFF
jgi:hypothetical protein